MKIKKKIIKSSLKKVVAPPKIVLKKKRASKKEKPVKTFAKIVLKKKRASKKEKPVKTVAVKTFVLTKPEENPIILPKAENKWEAWQTFNPGVVLLNDKVHFLYRAIGEDGISRFGYAISIDGFYIDERFSYSVYEHQVGQSPSFNIFSYFSGGSFGGAEDPRIVRVDNEDILYIIYTACDEGLRVALTSIKVNDFLNKKWQWKAPALISKPGETHKNWVIFPEKIDGKYAILHSISPEISIAYRHSLEFQKDEYIESYYNGNCGRKNCWDSWLKGAGAPPLRTRLGWLLFYHAIDKADPGKYKVGAMILDLNDPTKILYRAQEPVLEPEKEYENNGFKAGVVYLTGAVIKDGELLVYYGASDNYICVAHSNLELFLETLQKEEKPKLKSKTLKKKTNNYFD
ncbi:MAG: hypothetical protein KY055_00950 [Candidatus Nealsonbacteria bacterium]|nr:hypothetical protein [Candidatus Nealsonbacteria bacterium]